MMNIFQKMVLIFLVSLISKTNVLASNDVFSELVSTFEHSNIIILTEEKGEIYLSRTTDFFSSSSDFLEKTKPIKLSDLEYELINISNKDISIASHVFVIAYEKLDFKYILEVIDQYQRSLSVFSDYRSIDFRVILWDSYSDMNELRGSRGIKKNRKPSEYINAENARVTIKKINK